jgi:hypothetical protein
MAPIHKALGNGHERRERASCPGENRIGPSIIGKSFVSGSPHRDPGPLG